MPNFLVVSKFSSLPENVKIFKRDYLHFDEQALLHDIQSIDWDLLFNCYSDPSCMFDTFYSKISEFIDIHIPLKQLSKKESQFKTKPWITSAIRTSIKIKNKLYKKFLKTKSSYYQTKFKVYRNKLNHLIKISKRKYYNDYFSIHLNDGKRIWKGIKQIMRTTPQERQAISKVVLNDIEITDPTSKVLQMLLIIIAPTLAVIWQVLFPVSSILLTSGCHLLLEIAFSCLLLLLRK